MLSWEEPLRFTPHRNAAGEAYRAEACRKGWEGVIAKRADCPVSRGRSTDWLKFKCAHGQELVIGGYTEPGGGRHDFGALLLGYHDGADFVYAGKVGTGFDTPTLRDLGTRLRSRELRRLAVHARRTAHRAGCTGCGRSWCARSLSPSGPGAAGCATRATRGCAPTRTPPTW